MTKKNNTILFLIGGTIFNIIITVLCFFLFLFIYGRFLYPVLPEGSLEWFLPANFVASIVASFLIYRQIMKVLMKKIDMDKYFDPLFTRRHRPPKK